MKLKRITFCACLTALFLLLAGCAGKKEEPVATPTPEAAVEETKAPETEEPALSLLETVRKAIEEKDKNTLYQMLRYWDARSDKSGKYSIEMIEAFLEDVNGDKEKIKELTETIEDEFYDEDDEVITLPAVYIIVQSDTDQTQLDLPVFGERTIEDADQKAQKLGPLLPMSYKITARNKVWSKERSQTVDVSLKELPVEDDETMSHEESITAKHTYYVKFQKDASDDKLAPMNTAKPAASGRIVAIDAGHQAHGNYEEEPVGPGASETKPKVSSGTQGNYTGLAEYELTLAVAKKAQRVLQERGYQVVMIRESNDVDISNRERARIANDSGAQAFVRIHANSSESSGPSGTLTMYPGESNPYVGSLSAASRRLSEAIVDHVTEKTGFDNRGTVVSDDMSGINWCEIPVTILEMGFMSNQEDDTRMATEEYQDLIAEGIADGIDAFFGE